MAATTESFPQGRSLIRDPHDKLLEDHLTEMLPVVYDPVVAQAIERYRHEFQRPKRRLFVNRPDRPGRPQAKNTLIYPGIGLEPIVSRATERPTECFWLALRRSPPWWMSAGPVPDFSPGSSRQITTISPRRTTHVCSEQQGRSRARRAGAR